MQSIRSDIRFVQDQDGALVLDLQADRFFSLNPTAALIWDRLSSGGTLAEIAHALSCEAGIEEESALIVTKEFLAELAARNLLTTYLQGTDLPLRP